MPVDVVLAGPGLEELFLRRRRRHRRGGVSIPVASPEDLIVMKLLAALPRSPVITMLAGSFVGCFGGSLLWGTTGAR